MHFWNAGSEELKGECMVENTALDYSRYFWQGERIRLRPLRMEDAEQSFVNSLDSPSRQILQLGIEKSSTLWVVNLPS